MEVIASYSKIFHLFTGFETATQKYSISVLDLKQVFCSLLHSPFLLCQDIYCQDCDFQFHLWNVFHRRQLLLEEDSKLIKLKPNEFWDPTLAAEVVTKEI